MTILEKATETCPVCWRHPAVRGVTYGIDTYVCDSLSPIGMAFLVAGDFTAPKEYVAMKRLLVDRAPSIYERYYPLGDPQFGVLDESQDWDSAALWAHVDRLMLEELQRPRFISWTSGTPEAFEKPEPSHVPDRALGEGAVSPTRHLRNWQNRACTPGSLRSPST